MRYHKISHDDMLNGDGLRVVLFVSGCDHRCKGCQNPQTWSADSGVIFDTSAKEEIFNQLRNDYIDGLTISGGDPLSKNNLIEVLELVKEVKDIFPTKTIWIYTGYSYDDIMSVMSNNDMSIRQEILELSDVVVDGLFEIDLFNIKYPWAGSTNQRVIDLNRTRKNNHLILYEKGTE